MIPHRLIARIMRRHEQPAPEGPRLDALIPVERDTTPVAVDLERRRQAEDTLRRAGLGER